MQSSATRAAGATRAVRYTTEVASSGALARSPGPVGPA